MYKFFFKIHEDLIRKHFRGYGYAYGYFFFFFGFLLKNLLLTNFNKVHHIIKNFSLTNILKYLNVSFIVIYSIQNILIVVCLSS